MNRFVKGIDFSAQYALKNMISFTIIRAENQQQM